MKFSAVSTLVCVLAPMLLIPAVRGDEFDDALTSKVSSLNIRGAAVAYFDASKGMTEPIVRGYGRVSSSAQAAKVTPDTAFMLASISKGFTASAVAVLVDRGIISLDDDICKVLPQGYGRPMCRNPNYPNDAITWRMMITHRSSLKANIPEARDSFGNFISPSYGPSGGYTVDAPAAGNPTCPLDEVIDFYRALLTNDPAASTDVGRGVRLRGGEDLDWYELAQSNGGMWKNYRPGSRKEYSNLAFGYLAGLVELASGQSFATFCRDNLFHPLGMYQTAWFRNHLPDGIREAVPVEWYNNRFEDVGHYCFIDYASGELRTSASDLARWSESMLNYGAPTLWSKGTGVDIMTCRERTASGGQVNGCEFGYGWAILDNSMKGLSSTEGWLKSGFSSLDWTDGFWHDGAEAGSQTNIVILPRTGVYVAVVTNTDMNSESAAQQLTRTVVEAPLPPTNSPPSAPTPPPPSPTSQQPPPPTGTCPNQTEFLVKLKTDKYPDETKWTLKRGNKVLEKRGFNFYKKANWEYKESFCIPSTGSFAFKIFDGYYDGVCCENGSGSYEIYVDGKIKKAGGSFG
eukprot:CAMPEP_0181040034 /NCGR_PEP_ID=MMETSP1070-20121207/10822_1 /TAXON_ID=265543 /ORGANISM="Minutocellus polymorphus, Strain NH13" /LENGTH=572 /DNA_ID=CAMNT_0023117995 /DNA_START=76 /DNA_END=1791 /DNA_ORIENTATION=+